jgi:hypothetical protein
MGRGAMLHHRPSSVLILSAQTIMPVNRDRTPTIEDVMDTPINISLLDTIEIATPCTARWEEMTGDDRTRHCSHCSLNVYDISAMTRQEATNLIASTEGRLCVRLYRRMDGTVLTRDCPTGIRAARQRLARSIRNIAATVVALVAGMIGVETKPAMAQGGIMGGLAPRPARVEPPHTKKKQDTLQTKKDSVRNQPKVMIMGKMAIAPAKLDTVRLEVNAADSITTNSINSITTEPVVVEPAATEPMIPEPMLPEQNEPELRFVMGEMVILNNVEPVAVNVVTGDGNPDVDAASEPAVVIDGDEPATIR